MKRHAPRDSNILDVRRHARQLDGSAKPVVEFVCPFARQPGGYSFLWNMRTMYRLSAIRTRPVDDGYRIPDLPGSKPDTDNPRMNG